MARAMQRRERKEENRFHFEEGDQMPYHWPREHETGSRLGLHVAQAVCVALVIALVYVVMRMIVSTWAG